MNNDVRGRFPVDTPTPFVNTSIGRMSDRNWTVQQYTGYPVGTSSGSNWGRGSLYRWDAPTFRPALPPPMYDPTNPATW